MKAALPEAGADRLLWRAVDGGDLSGGRARHRRSGAGAHRSRIREPELFQKIIDRLVDASAEHLIGQIKAGADAVQIFDTWAGVLDAGAFERWCIKPTQRIVSEVRRRMPDAKIIVFPRRDGSSVARVARQVPVDAIGLDWRSDRKHVRERIRRRVRARQCRSLALLVGGEALDQAVDDVLAAFGARGIFSISATASEGNADRACRADDRARTRARGLMSREARTATRSGGDRARGHGSLSGAAGAVAAVRAVSLDQGGAHHRGDRLDGGAALSAAAVGLSLRRRAGLDTVGNLQGHGARPSDR